VGEFKDDLKHGKGIFYFALTNRFLTDFFTRLEINNPKMSRELSKAHIEAKATYGAFGQKYEGSSFLYINYQNDLKSKYY